MAELVECKQRGLAIVTYFGKLKKFWEELANFEQMPTSKCGLCTCNLGAALEKKHEEEKVHQFLMGLDETLYGAVRSNLLTQDPLPNLNRIYSTLVQEERVKIISHGKEELGEVMSFAVQAGFKSHNKIEGRDKNTVCSNCNCTGHEYDSFFQIIGYPDWLGEGGRTGHESDSFFQIIGYLDWWLGGRGGSLRASGRGNGRGKGRHQGMAPVGRGRGGFVKANALQVSTPGTSMNAAISDTDRSDVNGLNDE